MSAYRYLCPLFCFCTAAAYGVESSPPGTRGARYIGLHIVLTFMMFATARLAKANPLKTFQAILFTGIIARLVLVGVAPFNTHDVDRYLFDGRMVLDGTDPYTNNPDREVFSSIYEEGFNVAPEHRAYRTIYPPVALAVFTLCASLGAAAGFWLWKCLITAASILSLLLIAVVLRERGKHHWLVWLALSPLAILEVGIGAHADALSMLGVSCLVWGLHRGITWMSAAGLSFAILAKILPGWMLLAALVKPNLRRSFAGAVALSLGVYGLMMLLGFEPLGSLFEFARVWRFGSVLASLLGAFDMAHYTAIYPAVMFLGWMILTQRLQKKSTEMLLGAILAWGLATSPVLFPWYALSVLPLLAVAPSGILLGWTSALPFTYEVIDAFDLSEVWAPSIWPQIVLVLCAGLGVVMDEMNERQVVLGDRGQSHNSTNTE